VERHGWTEGKARQELKERDSYRQSFFRKYLHRDSNDPEIYDLVLNAGRLSHDEMAGQIVSLFQARRQSI
jgi:cytidylate kinase